MNRLEDFTPVFFDNDFKPLAGGTVEVWAGDNAKLIKLYAGPDAGDNEAANPVGLNSSGRSDTPVYFKESSAIIVLKDKAGVEVKSFRYSVSNSIRGTLAVEENVTAEKNVEAGQDVIAARNVVAGKDVIVDNKLTAREISAQAIWASNIEVWNDITVRQSVKTPNIMTESITADRIYAQQDVITKSIATDEITVNNLIMSKEIQIIGRDNVKIAEVSSSQDRNLTDFPVGSYILCADYDGNMYLNKRVLIGKVPNIYNNEFYTFDYNANDSSVLKGVWLCCGFIGAGNSHSFVLCRRVE